MLEWLMGPQNWPDAPLRDYDSSLHYWRAVHLAGVLDAIFPLLERELGCTLSSNVRERIAVAVHDEVWAPLNRLEEFIQCEVAGSG